MDVIKNALAIVFTISLLSSVEASQAIGFYSKGSLKDAQSVFDRAGGVHKLFVSRGKLYTTDEMHDLLEAANDYVTSSWSDSEVLQVGDLSGAKGGNAPRHSSHQNGLDADVVYLRHNGYVQPPEAPEWEEYFVKSGKVTSNFNVERNFALFRYLVDNFSVTRIFVDSSIKNAFCSYAIRNSLNDALTRQTLRRLRIADLHKTHFHVRLACPTDDNRCTPQSEPPQGTGCNALELMMEQYAQREGESC